MRWDVVVGVLGFVLTLLLAVQSRDPWVWIATGYAATAFFALLQVGDPATARRVQDGLSQDRYRPLYAMALARALPRAMNFLGTQASYECDGTWTILRRTLTIGLWERAFLVAILYPVLLLYLHWGLFGVDAKFGYRTVLPAADPTWAGYVTLVLIAIVLRSPKLRQLGKRFPQHFDSRTTYAMPLVVFALAFGFAFTFSMTFAFALAFLFVVVFSGSALFSATFSAAFPIVLVIALSRHIPAPIAAAFAITVLGARTIQVSSRNARPILIGCYTVLVPTLALAIAIYTLPWPEVVIKAPLAPTLLAFLGILPLLNAIFDFVSYVVTLTLLQRGIRGGALLCALIDAVIALLLFFSLGAAIIWVSAQVNRISGIQIVDLWGVLAQVGDLDDHWWLWAMLFSTALPTLMHLSLASLSLQAFLPKHWRAQLSALIEQAQTENPSAAIRAVLLLGALWFIGATLPFALLGGLGWLAWSHGLAAFLDSYRDSLIWIAQHSGGL